VPIIQNTMPRYEDNAFTRLRYGSFYPRERFRKDGSLKPPTPSRSALPGQGRSTAPRSTTGVVRAPAPAPVEIVVPFWRERLRQAGAFTPTPRPAPQRAVTPPEADAARLTPPAARASRPGLLGV
jgi:hypothetical protein